MFFFFCVCGRSRVCFPSDATDDEITYIESLVPRLEAGLLEVCDPDPGEVVFSCQRKVVQPAISVIRGVH